MGEDRKVLLIDISEKLESREIKRWPATILADNRTDSVIGRIRLLIISIMTMKFMRGVGVPIGVICTSIFFGELIHPFSMDDIHRVREIVKVINMWAVGVKLNGKRARELIIMTSKKIFVSLLEDIFFFELLIS